MKKADFIMIAVVCILAAAIFAIISIYIKDTNEDSDKTVYATCDGEEIGNYPLNTDCTIPIRTSYGYNLLVIKDNHASITEADCENHQCMNQGNISKIGECIICLPHHLVISIDGKDSPVYDVIVQ